MNHFDFHSQTSYAWLRQAYDYYQKKKLFITHDIIYYFNTVVCVLKSGEIKSSSATTLLLVWNMHHSLETLFSCIFVAPGMQLSHCRSSQQISLLFYLTRPCIWRDFLEKNACFRFRIYNGPIHFCAHKVHCSKRQTYFKIVAKSITATKFKSEIHFLTKHRKVIEIFGWWLINLFKSFACFSIILVRTDGCLSFFVNRV